MEIIKKYKVLFVLALILIAGVFFLFYRMYHDDVKALEGFVASYEIYDKAISDYSLSVFASNFEDAPTTDGLERKADEALVELNSKAHARLSSLIKNDAELMSTILEIADLSGKESDALKTYKRAAADQKVNLESLAKESGDLTNKRQTAYVRFRKLAGLED